MNLTDDEIIDNIRSGKCESDYILREVFTKSRINVVRWICSVMNPSVDQLEIHKDILNDPDDRYYVLNVYRVAHHLIVNFEVEILDIFYKSGWSSIGSSTKNFDIDLSISNFRYVDNSENPKLIRSCQWIYDTCGINGRLFTIGGINDMLILGNTEVLDWMLDIMILNNRPMHYTLALWNNPYNVIQWCWNKYLLGLIKFKPLNEVLMFFCNNTDDDDEILDILMKIINFYWDHRDKFPFDYDSKIFNCVVGDFTILLQWFIDRSDEIKFKYESKCVDTASNKCNLKVLDLLYSVRHRFEFTYTDIAMDDSNPETLNWWFDRRDQLKLKYSIRSIDCNSIDVWSWWIEHKNDLPIKYSHNVITNNMHSYLAMSFWWELRDEYDFKLEENDNCTYPRPITLDRLIYGIGYDVDWIHWWVEHIDYFPIVVNKKTLESIPYYMHSKYRSAIRTWVQENADLLVLSDVNINDVIECFSRS
jgi:hypothetical protein